MKLKSILMAVFTFVLACSLVVFGKAQLKASAATVDISDNITFTDWADEAELKYINIVFGDGTLADFDYKAVDGDYKYIQDYIEFNGRTVREINEDTTLGAADWTYTVFPSSADAKYKIPVMIYESSRKQLRFKIHSNYFAMLGNEITVTVKAGLELVNGETTSVVSKDVSHTYVFEVAPTLEEVDITTGVSASNWISQSELKVTYLNFGADVMSDGVNYDVTFGNYEFVQDYILINGRSVREINADTTLGASEWTYTVFPATADAKYKLPIILFAKTDSIEIKIHSEYVALLGNRVQITAKAGLQFENGSNLYKVTSDVTNTVWEEIVVEEVDITSNVSASNWISQNELKVTSLNFGADVMPDGVNYDVTFGDYEFVQDYILINGRSVREINADTTLGAADWTYTVFPATADAKYKLPIILFAKTDSIEIKIHSEYVALLGNRVQITAKAGLQFENGSNIYKVTSDVTNTVWEEIVVEEVDITSNVSASNWISQSELKVTYLNFGADVMPDGVNYDVTFGDYEFVQDYILINGRSVREINADTTLGAADWTYTVFPATADAKYKLPIILFAKTDSIEIKIHSEYVALLGNRVQITAKAGLQFENGSNLYKVTSDVTNTVWEVIVYDEIDITSNVTINGWDITGDASELSYTRISLGEGVLPAGISYGIMDGEYQFVQEYITINGRTVKEINEQTDVSSYTFSTFPSTASDIYKVPVIIYVNGETLEVKVHNDYLASLGENIDVVIGVKAGLQIVDESAAEIKKVDSDVEVCVRRKAYTLTVNDGDAQVLLDVAHGDALNLEDASKEGYTFEGWFEVDTDEAILSEMPTRDYEVYAKYTAIEYTVTFVADGVEVDSAIYTVENKEITEPTVPAKDGYAGEWESYELTLGDVTVNAVYTAIEYTVTFVVDGVEFDSAIYTVENKEITEPTVPAKDGYAGDWESYELTLGDVTVNAVYAVIEYTVTFVADGVEVDSVTYTVENKEITEPGVPAKDGYTGEWESYELTLGDVTVNAVYTEIEETESESEETSEGESEEESEEITSEVESEESVVSSEKESESKQEGSSGCMGSIAGSMTGLLALAGLAIVKLYRGKKD